MRSSLAVLHMLGPALTEASNASDGSNFPHASATRGQFTSSFDTN